MFISIRNLHTACAIVVEREQRSAEGVAKNRAACHRSGTGSTSDTLAARRFAPCPSFPTPGKPSMERTQGEAIDPSLQDDFPHAEMEDLVVEVAQSIPVHQEQQEGPSNGGLHADVNRLNRNAACRECRRKVRRGSSVVVSPSQHADEGPQKRKCDGVKPLCTRCRKHGEAGCATAAFSPFGRLADPLIRLDSQRPRHEGQVPLRRRSSRSQLRHRTRAHEVRDPLRRFPRPWLTSFSQGKAPRARRQARHRRSRSEGPRPEGRHLSAVDSSVVCCTLVSPRSCIVILPSSSSASGSRVGSPWPQVHETRAGPRRVASHGSVTARVSRQQS